MLAKEEKVGFTSVDAWISFSPCKNATADAATKSPPACALSRGSGPVRPLRRDAAVVRVCRREAVDARGMGRRRRRQPKAGHRLTAVVRHVPQGAEGPYPSPKFVSVTERSTLIVEGDVTVKSLQLDGGLVVKCAPGASCVDRALRRGERGFRAGPGAGRRAGSDGDPRLRHGQGRRRAVLRLYERRPGS